MTMKRSTRRPVHEVVPIDLRWVGSEPPEAFDSTHLSYQHDEVARMLRERPGAWAELPAFEPSYTSAINHGKIVAYRPSGTFEAIIRNHTVYARYVGEDDWR